MAYDTPTLIPPSECDADMIMQTLAVMRTANDSDIEFARVADTGLAAPFADYVEQLELPAPTWGQCRSVYAYVDRFLESVLIPAKLLFNVERPFVVAERLGIPFPRPLQSSTAIGPSYPSGHAGGAVMMAYGLAWMFQPHITDEQRCELFNIANRIAMSRVHIGVHTLQDIAEGCRLAHAAAEITPPTGIVQVRA
jgi:hypothetical protein